VKPLDPTIERLEERIAPGLVLPILPICPDTSGGGGGGGCDGPDGGSSAEDSHSSKTNSSKGTDSGTCHCSRHSH